MVGEAARDERLRSGDNVRGGDLVAEGVPGVPAERGREADPVAHLERQRALGGALRVPGGEDDLVVAALGNRTGEDLRRRVEREPFGEVLRRELRYNLYLHCESTPRICLVWTGWVSRHNEKRLLTLCSDVLKLRNFHFSIRT